jgi:hypothetical protein
MSAPSNSTAPAPQPQGQRPRWLQPGWIVALGFLAWATWLVLPALSGGPLYLPGLGSQDSDVIRGAWSLSQAAWGLPDPIWTTRAYFPVGIKVLPLPFGSGLLLAPVQLLLGSLQAYDVTVLALVAAAGWSTAWLGREITGSWGLGALAGGALLGQPMLLHSITDGTPEHLAVWSLPAVLAAAWHAQRGGGWRWPALVGLLLLTLLLDSPYMAVYGLVLAPFFLMSLLGLHPPQAESRWRRLRPLALCAAFALPALVVVALLYQGFTLAPQDFNAQTAAVELRGNSAQLRTWWALAANPASDARGNLVPGLIPTAMLLPALLLGLLGLRRGWPWLAAGLLMLAMALGSHPDNAVMLRWWGMASLGPQGHGLAGVIGDGIVALNQALQGVAPFSGIRFPRRWLVPAALALAIAASVGLGNALRLLGRIPRLPRPGPRGRFGLDLLGLALGLLLATSLLWGQPYLAPRTATAFPSIAFVDWLAAQPGDGAVLTLPTVRPGKPNTHRWELPVYANIGDAIRSADLLWFQLVHRRPVYTYPALFTVSAGEGLDHDADRLIRDSNDMSRPAVTGELPPSSAYEEIGVPHRAAGRAWLVERGLRFVVLDLGIYEDPWLEQAIAFYQPLVQQQRFDDGDGVLVLELER